MGNKVRQLFEKYQDEYLEFDRAIGRRHNLRDMAALLYIAEIMPHLSAPQIISATGHDVIYLSVDPEELEKIITDDVAKMLRRCGVSYDETLDSLFMYV